MTQNKVSIRDLKTQLSSYVQRVKSGGIIVITGRMS
jgi:prevent-host-death family protein